MNGVAEGDFVYADDTKQHLLAYSGSGGDVTIPSTVNTIGNNAFYGCTGLTSVTIPNSITSIGDQAFYGCTGLTSVTIPNSVTSIGEYAFYRCTGLTSVTIPNSVTSMGSAFYGCTGLVSATIQNSVIDNGAFNGCTGLTSVTIGNSVTSIGEYAFYRCTGLTSVTIPNSVTSIGDQAFYGCTGLTSVTIPSSVTSIGFCAFYNCTGLTSVTIPNSVTSIDGGAFGEVLHIEYYGTATGSPWGAISMNGVTEGDFIYADDTKQHLLTYLGNGGDVTIPSTVNTIGNSAFFNCTGLTIVTIPNSVTSIGGSAFSGCTGLTSVTIPNSVISIGDRAFYGCTGLTSVTIGNAVTSIGYEAFKGCTGLTSIITLASTAPSLGSDVVAGISLYSDVIIPCGCRSLYEYLWSYFNSFIEPHFIINALSADETMGYVEVLVQPTCQLPTAVINAAAANGYLFDHWSDGNTDNPRTLNVTQDTSLVAYFVSATDRLFTVVANNAMGGGVYPSGSTAVIFALPQVDLQFAGWDDGETVNPRYIVVTSDTTLTALFRAPDTVRVYDTTTVYDTVINIVYDTTEYNHYYYDTTHVYDTLVVFDTTRVYDTMVYVNIDTLHHYYFDTTRVFDTLAIIDTVNHYFFDSTMVYDTVVYVHVDTLHHYQYDTTYIVDTLVFYDTMSETHYVFDSTWVYDSVWVFDSVYITDSIYFFDTVYIEVPVQGIDGVEMVNVKVYTYLNKITVEGAEGMSVRLYDVNGRLLATKIEDAPMTHFYDQPSGAYVVRVGDYPARREVVIM